VFLCPCLHSSLLYLAAIGIVLPTAAAHVVPKSNQGGDWVLNVSRIASIMLLLCYVAYLVFQLHTHHDIFDGPQAFAAEEDPSVHPHGIEVCECGCMGGCRGVGVCR